MFTSSAIPKLRIRDVFWRICTFAFLFGALTTAASGQHLAVGVKGGVPLLDAFEQTASLPFFPHYTFNTKRYTVGSAVDVSLPLKLRFEADALYTRLDYDSTVMGVDTFTRSATRANSWQFPLLLKKRDSCGASPALRWYRIRPPTCVRHIAHRRYCLSDPDYRPDSRLAGTRTHLGKRFCRRWRSSISSWTAEVLARGPLYEVGRSELLIP